MKRIMARNDVFLKYKAELLTNGKVSHKITKIQRIKFQRKTEQAKAGSHNVTADEHMTSVGQ